jgi:hypothetical protein
MTVNKSEKERARLAEARMKAERAEQQVLSDATGKSSALPNKPIKYDTNKEKIEKMIQDYIQERSVQIPKASLDKAQNKADIIMGSSAENFIIAKTAGEKALRAQALTEFGKTDTIARIIESVTNSVMTRAAKAEIAPEKAIAVTNSFKDRMPKEPDVAQEKTADAENTKGPGF